MSQNLKIGLGILVLVLALQFVPLDTTNPPIEEEVAGSQAVREILRQSCYNCHSNQTRWPWYSRVAPISFLVASDVHEARGHVNFSTWNRYDAEKRVELRHKIWEEIEDDEMPLWYYRPLHPEDCLSDADKAVLRAWSQQRSKQHKT